ncbi:MAG: EpsG family protein [Lachnospiraceae bacterium]|nr:EpsG family protein [Lachnospiraceae bacterium]
MKLATFKSLKYKTYWIVLAVVSGFLFFNTAFSDLYITTRHGITFWTALFHGDFLNFYQYCQEGQIGYETTNGIINYVGSASYDISLYLIFALWNFPLWVIEQISGINTQEFILGILYSKLLILLFIFLSARALILIARKLDDCDAELVLYLFLSSVFVLTYAFGTGNYDIIACAFSLYGIEALLQGKKGKYIVLFAIANSMKYLTIFIFVPLVIYKNKKIINMVKELLLGVVMPVVILKGIFLIGGSGAVVGTENLGNLTSSVFGFNIGGGLSVINFLVIFYAFTCILAFLWNEETINPEKVIYLSFLSYASFIIFANINSYWVVILAPFLSLLIAKDPIGIKINLFLEMIFTLSLQLNLFMWWPSIPFGPSYAKLPLYQLVGAAHSMEKGTFITGYAFGTLLSRILGSVAPELLFRSIAFTAFIFLAVVNYPNENKKITSNRLNQYAVSDLLKIRMGLSSLLVLGPILTYTAQMLFYDKLSALF